MQTHKKCRQATAALFTLSRCDASQASRRSPQRSGSLARDASWPLQQPRIGRVPSARGGAISTPLSSGAPVCAREFALAADPNAAKARPSARLHFNITDAGAPTRIAVRIRPPEERNVQQIFLCRYGLIRRTDGPHSESRACSHCNSDHQAASSAEVTNVHPIPRFQVFREAKAFYSDWKSVVIRYYCTGKPRIL
jgi:hypothetical protein